MNEREWIIPGLVLTLVSGGAALLLTPNYSGIVGALRLLPLWCIISAIIGAFYAFGCMVSARVPNPSAHILHVIVHEHRRLILIAVGIVLTGLNMIAFMWAKPLLNYYIPFRADPALAAIDHAIFFGHDPWTFLGWLNTMPMAIFYHRAWFALMILTLLIIFSRPASHEKSAVMMTYFLLWSVAGPVIHICFPAAGPIFYEKLGYGDRFAGIYLPQEMVQMSDYLWRVYTTDRFGPGSGISAMPSLHIATTTWMVIATFVLARRWTWVIAPAGVLIFLLSISLAWHYATDGIVGGGCAVAVYALTKAVYSGRLTEWFRQLRGKPRFAGPVGIAAE